MRKNLIIYIFLLTISTALFCQLRQNAKFLDATISFNSRNETEDFAVDNFIPQDYKNHFLQAEIGYGWAIKENAILSFGFSLDADGYSYEYYSDFDERLIDFSEKEMFYSLIVSYERLFSLNEKILFSPQFSGSFGLGKKKYEETSGSLKNDLIGYSFSIVPGLQYFLTNKWVLTGTIGRIEYSVRTEKLEVEGVNEKPVNKERIMGAFFGLNTFGLGVRYYLNNSTE